MLLHHFTLVCTIGTVGFFDYYHGLASIAMLMEVNSIFLNFRHLLKIIKQCNTRVYRINSILNIFTLITCRIMESGKIFSYTEINGFGRSYPLCIHSVMLPTNYLG